MFFETISGHVLFSTLKSLTVTKQLRRATANSFQLPNTVKKA
jgi:hypothetical protein